MYFQRFGQFVGDLQGRLEPDPRGINLQLLPVTEREGKIEINPTRIGTLDPTPVLIQRHQVLCKESDAFYTPFCHGSTDGDTVVVASSFCSVSYAHTSPGRVPNLTSKPRRSPYYCSNRCPHFPISSVFCEHITGSFS